MTDMNDLATIFIDPIPITGIMRSLLLLPLCLSISIVYRALRSPTLDRLATRSLTLWLTIVGGMYAVGIAMWLVFLTLA